MLKVIQVSSPEAKRQYLNQINVSTDSWVVSDLQSREEVQISLGNSIGHFEGLTVVRASELWAEILKRSFPEFRIAGVHLSKLLLSEFLLSHQQYSSPRATMTLFGYMSQLMPVLSHPAGYELMTEWFESKSESSMRWLYWYDLSRHAWKFFEEQKVLCSGWANAFLANHWTATEVWDRRTYFDLGLDIHQEEAELIRILSESGEVVVFEPVKASHLQGDYSDRVYDLIRSFADEVVTAEAECVGSQLRQYLRMATPLAEVKETVSTVRHLLASGTQPNEIAILAPRIENYWFCLKSYLDIEGVAIRKTSSIRYSSLLAVQEWLAGLRIRVGHLSSSDLEMSYYGRATHPMPFEKFRSLFTSIYEPDHFERHEDLIKHFDSYKNGRSTLSRDEFIAFAIQWWPVASDFTPAKHLFQSLVQECADDRRFSDDQWVEYLQALATEQEVRVEQASVGGVYCGDIRSIEHVEAKHVFFLGLTASDLSQSQGHQIPAGDVEAIARDIGFYLNHPEQDHIEGLVRWFCQCGFSNQYFMFPMSDFQGVEKVPSRFWVKGASGEASEKIKVPEATRWDELRQSEESLPPQLSEVIQYDLGHKDRPEFYQGRISSLSASSVESYLRCPFIFAAQKVFGLADEPIADVDFEARGKGLVIHKLFEELLEPPVNFNRSDKELHELLDKIAEDEKLNRIEERFWPAFRERMVQLAKRFLEKERRRKAEFPSTSTVGRELNFNLYFDVQTSEITLEPKPGAIRFRGQIDRLDIDENNGAVIYDYKTSKTEKMTHASRWLETDQIQLAIYTLAVESGATGVGSPEVIGAFYYIIKDLNDFTGFRLKEEGGRLFSLKDSRKDKISRDEKIQILDSIRDHLKVTIDKMIRGEFSPKPAKREYCERCSWSRVCRAPHLH